MPAAGATILRRRDRAIVVGGLALLGGLAWMYLVHFRAPMTAHSIGEMGMDGAMGRRMASGWQGADVLLAFLMWVVMMVAMMTPSATPLLLMVATVSRQRHQHPSPTATAAAVFAGYLAAWAGFSLVATLAQWGLQSAAWLSPTTVSVRPLVAGLLLLVAGAYQFTRFKDACLSRCRSPLGFLLAEWRDGTSGAVVMGVRHGLYCVGCCWLLMALLFAVGVMNLVWVALLAVTVLLEKVSPEGSWFSRTCGVLMVGWGIRTLLTTL